MVRPRWSGCVADAELSYTPDRTKLHTLTSPILQQFDKEPLVNPDTLLSLLRQRLRLRGRAQPVPSLLMRWYPMRQIIHHRLCTAIFHLLKKRLEEFGIPPALIPTFEHDV